MGLLVDGEWRDQWYDTKANKGRFERSASAFRNWITPDGAAGPSGEGGFHAQAGRYHLYVSYACPWAHRTLIFRKLKKLDKLISVSSTHWLMQEHGWTFEPGPDVAPDAHNGAQKLHQIYTKSAPQYSGRVTVPVLWDLQRGVIVSNESSEIIRMFNSAFNGLGAAAQDYYPQHLRAEIDAVNERVYREINNGVYRAGFATSQAAYDEAVTALFGALDWLEERLANQDWLLGAQITEADWRLFTTLVRFDAVYVGHFKCNLRTLQSYPNLWDYTRALYQAPGVAETVNFQHIKGHYYESHTMINPTGITPAGPILNFNAPTQRKAVI